MKKKSNLKRNKTQEEMKLLNKNKIKSEREWISKKK